MAERPLVRVGPYGVLGDYEQATCSRCGLLGTGSSSSIVESMAERGKVRRNPRRS